MDQPQEPQQPTLLNLPREIRDKIYNHLFAQPQAIDCYRVWFTTPRRLRRQLARERGADDNNPDCCGRRAYGCGAHFEARLRPHGTALLRTCTQIHDEGTEVLYGCNVFAVALEQRCVFLRLFGVGERNLRLVRHVNLTAYTDYHGYYITRDPDDARPRGDGHWGATPWEFFGGAPLIGDDHARAAGWRALMGGALHTLQVAALVPNWAHHRGWPVWVDQLEHVLRTIGDAVPEDAEVTVDDNHSLFLCDAVDRCFSAREKGFRRVRLPEGDAHYDKQDGRFDPDDVGGAPLDCEGKPVPEEVLMRLPSHPVEALPSALFSEDDDESRR